jgi:hypothetical protein
MKPAILSSLLLLCVLSSCRKAYSPLSQQSSSSTKDIPSQDASAASARTIASTEWTAGALPVTTNPSQQVLPATQLKPLGVTLSGNKSYKSNNPEIFRGNGWLMQNSRTDATRGGSAYALSGTNTVYLFHINQSGATKYLHLLVTNPNAGSITVSSKGSYYTNAEKPLTGSATGQSYFVAKDWLNGTLRQPQTANTTLAQFGAKEIFKLQMNNSNMIDGRFEVTTSGGAYYYTVVTSNGSTTDAINASQASFAAGDYYTESTNTYGREAGVYAFSNVSADNDLVIPASASHIGFALNTSSKFSSSLENQVASSLMTMSGASSKTYGNYGHKYSVTFRLQNNNSVTKTVKLYFASNSVDATKSNATWNGPIKMNGSVVNVYTRLNAPRQQLSTWSVPPGLFNVTLEFYVPGLITANQQLIFETN